MSKIDFLVDRMHVGTSYLAVVREIVSRCHQSGEYPAGRKAFLAHPKKVRRDTICAILERHHANRKTYTAVMTGRF